MNQEIKETCMYYKGSVNVVINYAEWVCNEMLLNIVAKDFSGCCNKKHYCWNELLIKQTKKKKTKTKQAAAVSVEIDIVYYFLW